MLTITVDFLLGTYRADPTGLAHTGRQEQGEWPPSPLRLLAALVAADGTRDRCRYTTGAELLLLESAPPPRVHASAAREVRHQPLLPRYVVRQSGKAEKGAHQEYQGRKGAQVRPGVRVAPRRPTVTYVWDVEPSPVELAGLRARAARVGYLGTSDSPVAVTVGSGVPDDVLAKPYIPDGDGDVVIGVPQPGVLAAMDAHYDRWLELGPSVHRSQSPGLRRLARYRSPGSTPIEPPVPGPTVLWLRFERPVSGRRVIAVTAALKATVLDRYQRRIGEPPPVLHGHVEGDSGYLLACYLALPDVGHRHAGGLLHGAAVVLPSGTDDDVVGGCRAALHATDQLVGGGFSVGVRPWAGEDRPRAATPSRWVDPDAVRFATAFPALHERRKVALTLDELGRWCEHAGLPSPVAARSGRSPFLPGGIDLRPVEVNRSGRVGLPYSHLEIEFASPPRGLVVLGAGRTRGLGLCAPVRGSA